jgi:hypothetical protein
MFFSMALLPCLLRQNIGKSLPKVAHFRQDQNTGKNLQRVGAVAAGSLLFVLNVIWLSENGEYLIPSNA